MVCSKLRGLYYMVLKTCVTDWLSHNALIIITYPAFSTAQEKWRRGVHRSVIQSPLGPSGGKRLLFRIMPNCSMGLGSRNSMITAQL